MPNWMESEAARWSRLGWKDIASRYRRTTIGPLWIVLVMAATVGAIGIVYSSLFGIAVGDYLPYVAIGIVMWTWISATLIESCSAFSAYRHILLNYPILPLSVIIRIVSRNLLILGHNALVIVFLFVVLKIPVGWIFLLSFAGALIVLFSLFSMSVILAYTCARFSDITQLTVSLLGLLFLVSPIIWNLENLGDRAYIAEINPVTHLLAVIREPMLGNWPSPNNWMISLLVAFATGYGAYMSNRHLQDRVRFWL